MIALEDLHVRLGGAAVLDGISLEVRSGERMALIGPSGSGKTTLLRVLLGFVAPQRGRVRLGDRVASEAHRILRPPEERNLAVVFQDLALWPHLRVHGQLAFGLDAHGVPRAERDRRIATLLRRVDLAGKEDRFPHELSGGEKQRVAIARALVLDPAAVLLDEPLANVDVVLKPELLALFRELLVERATTAISVTHDLEEARALGDRVAVLVEGRIRQVGAWQEVCAQPVPFLARMLAARPAK